MMTKFLNPFIDWMYWEVPCGDILVLRFTDIDEFWLALTEVKCSRALNSPWGETTRKHIQKKASE